MASIYDKASLVMIPSGSKEGKLYSQKPVSGDGDFTFSRSTMATRVNADGNIEKETQNLLLQSNSFDTTWINNLGGAVTGGQAGYDGTNNAWEINKNTTSFRRIEQSGLSLSGIWTLSVYAKAGTRDIIALRNFVGGDRAEFNLTSGTITNQGGGTIIARSMTDVGNGWYRCSITCNSTSTQIQIYVDWNQTIGGNIYIQDAQLEQGLVARDYIETTTSAVEGGITDNVPRLDYTDSSCPALLLEPQRTNELSNSEYGFGNTNSTITYNNTTSPEGLQNAFKLTENTASGSHRAQTSFNADADTYTFSVFAKAGERNYINFAGSNVGAFSSTFNLSTGVLEGINGGTGSIEDYGNGWYRLIVTKTISSAGGVAVRIGTAKSSATQPAGSTQSYTGDGTSGLYLYGYMVERGSYATSYIPTYGTSVTRNAESTEKTSIGDLLGATEGTFYAEFTIEALQTAYAQILNANYSTQNSVYMIYRQNNTIAAGLYIGGSPIQIDSTSTYTRGDVVKVAFTYKSGDIALYINGQSEGTLSTAWTFPTPIDRLYIADNIVYFAYQEQVRMRQVLVFKTRLSNEELADLTTL